MRGVVHGEVVRGKVKQGEWVNGGGWVYFCARMKGRTVTSIYSRKVCAVCRFNMAEPHVEDCHVFMYTEI